MARAKEELGQTELREKFVPKADPCSTPERCEYDRIVRPEDLDERTFKSFRLCTIHLPRVADAIRAARRARGGGVR